MILSTAIIQRLCIFLMIFVIWIEVHYAVDYGSFEDAYHQCRELGGTAVAAWDNGFHKITQCHIPPQYPGLNP